MALRNSTTASCALVLALLSGPARAASAWTTDLSASAVWNSNTTNSDRASDKIGALQWHVDATTLRPQSAGPADTFFFGAQLGVDSWPRFDGLDVVTVGPRLAWQHKSGLGPLAPIFRIDLTGDRRAARDADRAGFAGSVAWSWRQRIDDVTRVSLRYERSRQDARESVYDGSAGEATLEVARDVGAQWRLTLAARAREGDALSYATPPRPDLVALARERSTVDTYHETRVAYRLNVHALSGSLAASRALDDFTLLSFSYDYRRAERGPLTYVNHLVSVALVRQF